IGIGWGDLVEGDFEAVGIFAALANLMKELRRKIRRRRLIQQESCASHALAGEFKATVRPDNTDTIFPELVRNKILRQAVAMVPVNEGINAASSAAGGDISQSSGGNIAKIHRERSHYQE